MNLTIVVDDERTLNEEGAVHLRTSAEALSYLALLWTRHRRRLSFAEPQSITLWLDHDLGDGDDSNPVALFLVELARLDPKDLLPIECIYVHSQNPVGKQNLRKALCKYYPTLCVGLPDHMSA